MVARMRFTASRWAVSWVAPGLLLMAVLAGCASGPGTAPRGSDRDGAETNPPSDLARVPDAEPRLEPIRNGGPNKPYDVLGRSYVPITGDAKFTERGLASWYGKKFHGKRTASGEVYNMYAMTAAHPTLPIPSYARIRNPANGKEVVSIPFGEFANHFPTPSVGDGLLLLPGTNQVVAFMGPAGRPPPPPAR